MSGPVLSRLLIIVGISTWGHAFGQSYEEGLQAAQNGDYHRAYAIWKPMADAGVSRAQYALGLMHENGHGVELNYHQARAWYKKAAVQGDARAQHNLALLYIGGEGGSTNYEEAIVLLLSAAKSGSAESLYQLSELYMAGKGRPKDIEGANKFLEMAAERGHALAHNNLGVSYYTGLGVEVDMVQAHKWFLTAYQQWSADKQYYEPGTEEDIVSNLRSTTLELDPGQLNEAQRLSTEWLASFNTEPCSLGVGSVV